MSKPIYDSIKALCQRRLAALREVVNTPLHLQGRIIRIVAENLAKGRFDRFAANHAGPHSLTLEDYVDIVILRANQEYTKIQALESGDSTEWERLEQRLWPRACKMIRSFRAGTIINAEAADLVQEACISISKAHYPYDVSFEAWATTILKNAVLARFTRSRDMLNQPKPLTSLEEAIASQEPSSQVLSDLIADPASLAPFEQIQDQNELLHAIAKLHSRVQQQVIIFTFFDELNDEEIAKRLGKSKQSIYNLRQRALIRLRTLIDPTRKKNDKKSIKKNKKTHATAKRKNIKAKLYEQ